MKQAFSSLGSRRAFIPYITAGDPDLPTTAKILDALAEGGATVIEIGIPFSDPMADGEVIQAAMQRALKAGTTYAKTLELVADFRTRHDTPIILFGYLNPFFHIGLERCIEDAKTAGADGFLIVDLTSEEAGPFSAMLEEAEMDLIGLFTPTSADDRITQIAKHATGFAYYVSMTGITGDPLQHFEVLERQVTYLKGKVDIPVAVGFGIQSPEDVQRISQFADGVIVGSAIVRAMADAGPDKAAEVALRMTRAFVAAAETS